MRNVSQHRHKNQPQVVSNVVTHIVRTRSSAKGIRLPNNQMGNAFRHALVLKGVVNV